MVVAVNACTPCGVQENPDHPRDVAARNERMTAGNVPPKTPLLSKDVQQLVSVSSRNARRQVRNNESFGSGGRAVTCRTRVKTRGDSAGLFCAATLLRRRKR